MGVSASASVPTLTVPKADFIKGVATLTSVPTYTFNAVTTVPTTIKIRAVDSVNAGVTSSGFTEGTTEIRSGRLKIPNVYGSELLPLSMAVTAQFYNASNNWVTSTTDNVTSLSFPASYPIGATGTTLVTKSPTNGKLSSGVLTINLSPPGAGKTGSTLVAPTPPLSYLPLTPANGGTATFGIYKGNNSIIYMRENY
jgi:MSHA biogenesis protein MshQ